MRMIAAFHSSTGAHFLSAMLRWMRRRAIIRMTMTMTSHHFDRVRRLTFEASGMVLDYAMEASNIPFYLLLGLLSAVWDFLFVECL